MLIYLCSQREERGGEREEMASLFGERGSEEGAKKEESEEREEKEGARERARERAKKEKRAKKRKRANGQNH